MGATALLFILYNMQQYYGKERNAVDRPAPEIKLQNVVFSYPSSENERIRALDGVSFSVEKGEYLALLGRNGSGKSSVAKLVDVLEFPDEGDILIMGYISTDESTFWTIRKNCGMVFQNPDNQIVGTTVEEDVAFGPENLGIPTKEIRRRVDDALSYVGLSEYTKKEPYTLSGGQKQRLAIAGILAMEPRIMILDEATAMLDPIGREAVLSLTEKLIREKGITVIHITHDMTEAARADRVLILEKGRIAMEGKPSHVFSQVEFLRDKGLDVPFFADILHAFSRHIGIDIPSSSLESEQTSRSALLSLMKDSREIISRSSLEKTENARYALREEDETALCVKNLSYRYEDDEALTLDNISFSVRKGECLSIIGHSGSGKTTLITHLNGLIRPQTGDVLYHSDAEDLSAKNKSDLQKIREHVGLLFQYPEYQLFEETVAKDVAFGPKMMGLSKEETKKRVEEALSLVGIGESFMERSPFSLSGGEKRRVAFAGILAMDPDVLVLDEPAAGLDPAGRKEIFAYIRELKRRGKTIVLVSHDMDEAASCCDRILILRKGVADGPQTREDLFSQPEKMKKLDVTGPKILSFLTSIKEEYPSLNPWQYTVSEAVEELLRAMREDG